LIYALITKGAKMNTKGTNEILLKPASRAEMFFSLPMLFVLFVLLFVPFVI